MHLCALIINMKDKKGFIYYFNHSEEILIVSGFVLMVLTIFIQVVMRYVFNNSLYWSEELGKFLFVWISWLGISLGEREGEHIKITILTDRLSFRNAQLANIISSFIVLIICATISYYAYSLVISQMGAHYAGIKISMSFGYLAVLLGCLLMCIRGFASIVRSVKALKSGQPKYSGGEINE